MNKTLLTGIVSLGLLAAPLLASATPMKVEGTVRGYNCVVVQLGCSIDSDDPATDAERVFVVNTPDGYYYVPNVSRDVLARYATHEVIVTGELDSKYRSIRAETIRVREGDAWKQVWSREREEARQQWWDAERRLNE